MKGISESIVRSDFDDKIKGKAMYTCDYHPEGMLFVKTVRSTVPRGRIRHIEIPELPKGYEIINHQDIPHLNVVPVVFDDQPVLAYDEVNYIGQPILLVVGDKKEIIQKIITEIQIDIEELEPVLSIEEAQKAKAPFIFRDQPYFVNYEYTKGDFVGEKEKAIRVISDVFETGYQEQAYLETQSMVAEYDGHTVSVFGSMQCPYYIVETLKEVLGWPEDRIRVVQMPTGGAFGGKEEYPSIPAAHAALASIKTGKPVQLVFERQEDIQCSTKRHPSIIRIDSYIDENDIIIARDIDVKLDGGAFAGLSSVVLQRSIFSVSGVYKVEHLHIKGTAYATNKVVTGAFRGFGGPQAFFAMERHMDNIANQLNIDAVEFKRKHYVKQGDTSSTGGEFSDPVILSQLTEEVLRISDYHKKRKAFENDLWRGIGFSAFFHGCGFTGAGESELIKPSVRLKKVKDKVEIFISSTEIGQGVLTTMRKIVAKTLDIPVSDVIHNYPDTLTCPDSGPTVASRTMLIVGRLLQDCALRMKQRWQEDTFEILQNYTYPSHLHWNSSTFEGHAYPDFSWGTNVVEVEVDPMTYQTEVKGIWAVYDVGTMIDERIVQGQLEGGIVQGLGYGLCEALESVQGKILQDTFTTYIIPTSLDIPKIVSICIENPSTIGPYGARGLGELPLVGVAPALANAVSQAIGKKITKIPVTPEELLRRVKYDD